MAQWRQRYELMRLEYESLLRRVAQLETDAGARPPLARFAPQHGAPASGPPREHQTVAESIVSPLLRMRDEYLAAAASIDSVISGLEGLAAGAFREQRLETPVHIAPRARRAPPSDNGPVDLTRQRPQRIQLDARAKGFGELLDFQERLAAMPGVGSVSVNAVDSERATLTVELKSEVAAEEADPRA